MDTIIGMKRWIICLILCLLPCFPALAASDLKYDLQLDLDVDASVLHGEARIDYTHNGPRELKELLFRLDANLQAQMEIQEVKTKEGLILPSRHYQYEYLEQKQSDPLLYQVNLPEALKPGDKTELIFKYLIRYLPRHRDSYYLLDDRHHLGLGSWYPRLIPFQDNQWQIHARTPADYQVKARANRKLYVISPLSAVSINNTDRSYQYSAENAEEMSLIYTPNLLLRSAEIEGVQVRFYYDSSLQKWSPMTLEIIGSALRYFRERYASWPVRRLTVVSIEDSRYPVIAADELLVMRNSFAANTDEAVVRRRLAEHLVYGLAQQFWGYQVAQPAEQIPWITQGLSLFVAQDYLEKTEKKPFLLGDALSKEYLRAARQGWSTSLNQPLHKLERLPLDSFKVLAQGKGYLLFRLLERMLGKKVMQDTENRLLQQYRNRPLTPEALQAALQQVSGKELEWFFLQWVRRSDTLDYAVQGVQQTQTDKGVKATITVQNLGKITMPMTIALKLENGETQLKLWDGAQASERLTYDLKSPLKEVMLDPSESTPDIDPDNNRFVVEKTR